MVELIRKYTAYNLWANSRLIQKLSTIPADLLNKELKSSFPSVTKTILHMYDAETIWLKRLSGVSLTGWPSEDFNGSAEDALKLLEKSSFEIAEYAVNIPGEKITGECSFSTLSGESNTMNIYDIVMHSMNHSTFHRGQIITMLRELDITDLPSTDYIAYIWSNEK